MAIINNNYNKQPLTREGNAYKPVRLGLYTGLAAGGLTAFKVANSNKFSKTTRKLFNDAFEAKGFKQIVKSNAKLAAGMTIISAMIAGITTLGGLLGNSLIDAPINNELRDQADGEAARKRAEKED